MKKSILFLVLIQSSIVMAMQEPATNQAAIEAIIGKIKNEKKLEKSKRSELTADQSPKHEKRSQTFKARARVNDVKRY
jgi:hypothetical protein